LSATARPPPALRSVTVDAFRSPSLLLKARTSARRDGRLFHALALRQRRDLPPAGTLLDRLDGDIREVMCPRTSAM
jgi:hypothetical protein